MLQLAIICPGAHLAQQLFQHLPQIPDVEFTAVLRKYPTKDELFDLIRTRGAQALLLSADEIDTSHRLAALIDTELPGFPVITASDTPDTRILAKFMDAGVRNHLTSPIQPDDLRQAIESVRKRIRVTATPEPVAMGKGELVTFLPARAGVGATTLAAAVSGVLSEQLKTRTLLMDCDLDAGVIPFLLKVRQCGSLLEVLEHASVHECPMLGNMAGHWHSLDLLSAGPLEPRPDVNLSGLREMLNVARERYEIVVADLPSSLDGLTDPLLRESSRIFLVTTGELASLHMASIRVRQLTARGLLERVRLIFNRRVNRNKSRDREIEEAVGIPVSYSLANDYAAVQTAIMDPSPAGIKGELGQGVLALAKVLAATPQKEETPKRRFLEFFSVNNSEATGWSR